MSAAAKLTLADIVDMRAYEREREEFRDRIIALKKVRRISIGPVVTLLFENRDTIRFQIQEMARAERMMRDDQIQTELDTYNPLVPGPGELAATMFIELTSKVQLEEWLPKLVGIERSVVLRMGAGDDVEEVRCQVDEAHAEQLTRDTITASVHYIGFRLTADQVARFAEQPVALATDHPSYQESRDLSAETKAELLKDLKG
jgi:hypothetical protein